MFLNLIEFLITIILFALPAYFGNMAPVFLGGGPPMDGGKSWKDGKRILGPGKTWRGFFGGIFVASITGMTIGIFEVFDEDFVRDGVIFGIIDNSLLVEPLLIGFLIGFLQGFGALVGDALGSFIKRRRGIERGGPLWGLDQLGFIVLAMIFVFPYYSWPLEFIIIIPLTFFVHLGANATGYVLGMKDVPW